MCIIRRYDVEILRDNNDQPAAEWILQMEAYSAKDAVEQARAGNPTSAVKGVRPSPCVYTTPNYCATHERYDRGED